MKRLLSDSSRYCIGIRTADGRNHCIRGWYADKRCKAEDCPRGYYKYDFRASDTDEDDYTATIEPFLLVNHSGTFLTRTRIPFNEDGNGSFFEIRYDYEY